jgi:hypothetical protein
MPYSYSQQPPEAIAQSIPVGRFLAIPGAYETKVLNRTLDGRNVKIQLWKGFCPSYLPELVGGTGAEVGIYVKSSVDGLWYPDYHHRKKIWFKLLYGSNATTFFTAEQKTCWWRHKWMISSSYAAYKMAHLDAPVLSRGFKLKFKITGSSNTIEGTW